MSNLAKNVASRFAAKSKGPDIRSKLNNARISLNHIQSKYGRGTKNPDFKEAVKDFTEVLDEITAVIFSIHDGEAKSHITKTVISEIEQGIDAAQAADQYGIEVSAGRASTFLEGAIEHLDNNPDAAEKKERLSGILAFIFPSSEQNGSMDHRFDEAMKLCKEIAEDEKAKAKSWFTELADALEKVSDAKKDLRSATAFSYKMLPKAR